MERETFDHGPSGTPRRLGDTVVIHVRSKAAILLTLVSADDEKAIIRVQNEGNRSVFNNDDAPQVAGDPGLFNLAMKSGTLTVPGIARISVVRKIASGGAVLGAEWNEGVDMLSVSNFLREWFVDSMTTEDVEPIEVVS